MAKDELLQDSLLREVEEDLRRDRMLRLWKRYGTYAIAVVVGLLLAVAGFQVWKHFEAKRLAEASMQFAEANAAAATDPALATAGFAALGNDGPRGYALLSRLQEAALLARQGDHAAAVAAYDRAARSTDIPVYRDLATLLSVLAAMQAPIAQLEANDVQSKLARLAADNNPWRFSARELQALMALNSGQAAEAERLLKGLVADPQVPAGVRERAEILLATPGSAG
ncbi:MAG: tetratricopeptide repeat protein [Rhodospirillales bacterium]